MDSPELILGRRAELDGYLSYEAGNALSVTDQAQLVAFEGTHLAVGQHHPRRDYTLAESAVLVAAVPYTSLSQPATNCGRRRAGRVGAQGQILLGQFTLQILPYNRRPDAGGHRVVVDLEDLAQPMQVNRQTTLYRHHTTIP